MSRKLDGKESLASDDISIILVRVLNAHQSEEDMRAFFQWYHACEENKQLFFQLKQLHDLKKEGRTLGQIQMEASWTRLLEKKVCLTSESLLQQSSSLNSTSAVNLRNRRRALRRIPRYAVGAAIVLLLTIVGIYFLYDGSSQMEWVDVVTEMRDEPTTIVLPDGSEVYLNASSKFRYPKKFSTKSREVYLDGEAYFRVKKETQRSFVVHTDKQLINVLGTEFNVLGYASDPYTVTTLVAGKVKLNTYDNENNLKDEILLEPDHQLHFHKESSHTMLSEVNCGDVISWLKGVYSFRDVSLGEITSRLEKIYGVKIVVPDEKDRLEKYTGKFFLNQTIAEVIDVLNFKGQFQLKFNEDTILFCREATK